MEYIGESAALGAALTWSFSSFLFTTAVKRIGAMQLNISRLMFATVYLLITIAVLGIDYSMSWRQFIYLSISGVIGLVIGDGFLFMAFKEVGPRISMLLMASNPAMAAIISYFILAENMSLWGIAGMAITLAGISVVVLERHDDGNGGKIHHITRLGILYGFLAAAGQAVGLIFAKAAYLEGDINGLAATLVRIGSSFIIFFPITLLFSRNGNSIMKLFSDRKSLGLVAFGSVIGPYLGVTLSFFAVIYTKVGIASTLLSTSPIIMLPLSRLFYHERQTWKAIVGAIAAVAGVGILFLV